MKDKKENILVIIENGQLKSYTLDDKTKWEVGRPSKNNDPDIKLYSTTVSRKHGKFENLDGLWFYVDYNGKNGTVYNHKYIRPGLKGRIKSVMLKEGDVFVFGGSKEEVINCKTVFGLFLTKEFEDGWRIVDTNGYEKIKFITDDKITLRENPKKGMVLNTDQGIAIYMGSLTYLTGNIEIKGYETESRT